MIKHITIEAGGEELTLTPEEIDKLIDELIELRGRDKPEKHTHTREVIRETVPGRFVREGPPLPTTYPYPVWIAPRGPCLVEPEPWQIPRITCDSVTVDHTALSLSWN